MKNKVQVSLPLIPLLFHPFSSPLHILPFFFLIFLFSSLSFSFSSSCLSFFCTLLFLLFSLFLVYCPSRCCFLLLQVVFLSYSLSWILVLFYNLCFCCFQNIQIWENSRIERFCDGIFFSQPLGGRVKVNTNWVDSILFHPADLRGITSSGLPGIPTQLDIFHRSGTKGCLGHRFWAPPSLHCSIANSASTQSQQPEVDRAL